MNATFLPELITIIQAKLEQLEKKISSFEQPFLWKTQPSVLNSAGNLTLHLLGNLNYYIGAVLGQTGYIRNRENEFAAKDVPSVELLHMIRETHLMIGEVLNSLPEVALHKNYPMLVFDKPMSSSYFLMHLSAHLAYHLGQINYLRRILQG